MAVNVREDQQNWNHITIGSWNIKKFTLSSNEDARIRGLKRIRNLAMHIKSCEVDVLLIVEAQTSRGGENALEILRKMLNSRDPDVFLRRFIDQVAHEDGQATSESVEEEWYWRRSGSIGNGECFAILWKNTVPIELEGRNRSFDPIIKYGQGGKSHVSVLETVEPLLNEGSALTKKLLLNSNEQWSNELKHKHALMCKRIKLWNDMFCSPEKPYGVRTRKGNTRKGEGYRAPAIFRFDDFAIYAVHGYANPDDRNFILAEIMLAMIIANFANGTCRTVPLILMGDFNTDANESREIWDQRFNIPKGPSILPGDASKYLCDICRTPRVELVLQENDPVGLVMNNVMLRCIKETHTQQWMRKLRKIFFKYHQPAIAPDNFTNLFGFTNSAAYNDQIWVPTKLSARKAEYTAGGDAHQPPETLKKDLFLHFEEELARINSSADAASEAQRTIDVKSRTDPLQSKGKKKGCPKKETRNHKAFSFYDKIRGTDYIVNHFSDHLLVTVKIMRPFLEDVKTFLQGHGEGC